MLNQYESRHRPNGIVVENNWHQCVLSDDLVSSLDAPLPPGADNIGNMATELAPDNMDADVSGSDHSVLDWEGDALMASSLPRHPHD